MPQLNLNFIDIPIPETHLWEQFDDEQKTDRHRELGAPPCQSHPESPSGADQ
jgi:hypothetical protein